MAPNQRQQLGALCDHLAARRAAILGAWRIAAEADPLQTTGRTLTHGQFNDHVPEVLDAFEDKLRARVGGDDARAASVDQKRQEVKHGLHRWQQGYRLQELMHEWGHLQLCLFEEMQAYARAHPEFEREALAEANRQMITLVNQAIYESTGQYERMEQAEAAGHMQDLTEALASVSEIENRRASLIHEAVHDLHNDVYGVTVAARMLGATNVAESERLEFAQLLQRGVKSVTIMLNELMELARLEARQEQREISQFDAAALLAELGNTHRQIAHERGLFLSVEGPTPLTVDGDPARVRRLVQNLLLNAIKYTHLGGVRLSCGEGPENWWMMVKDTGPGMLSGPGAPMGAGLKEATASARESDVKATAATGETSQVLKPPSRAAVRNGPAQPQPGEGIGLSIVKRLCELLDASLEMASSAETGTTFRVVLPRRYQAAAPAVARRAETT